jgi:hypothetical protein
MTHQFIPFQPPKAFQNAASRRGLGFARWSRWFGCAVHHASAVSSGEMQVRFHSAIVVSKAATVSRVWFGIMALMC